MTGLNIPALKNHLTERRERLQETVKYVPDPVKLYGLLQQVDSALERIDNGSYGICNVCHDPIEEDRLLVDPLTTVCLDHLDHHQRKALEQDLEFAIKIQRNLLPENNLKVNGWEFSYNYSPAGPVSGDFCDFIKLEDGSVLFALGDVSGKGISASLMMSHLHALIRSLLSFNLPVNEIVTRANRLFCESTVSTHYATMVFGKASQTGDVEICIAGHNPPLVINNGKIASLNATGIPVGLFCHSEYELINFKLQKDDSLILYTDGLTEASFNEIEYGEERLKKQLLKSGARSTQNIINDLIDDQKSFLKDSPRFDDITISILKRI
ncbi:MAG: SpoIIE family protein phosphatase [Ignavibacteriaceae bacterium]|jgi:sigma-B regulation protein RsbU (phosphoserine phosphatase)|nr:SpoIIE family protein phosphatase [Ignavibacteriaceae bacterium]MCW8811904.1 SpoIIE family protein phosphatase [Chlorobium sp.]MCW8995715.1 SpoIIE family protein phosphatase [Psychromonas sp.]MCW8824499.1 SpoIIE family protein phosphatase [Ignavibacteriaceae bacterium]MCW8960581.1 SpoIIE family protein phosphatase [Ignavibacteriaceae bacterium]